MATPSDAFNRSGRDTSVRRSLFGPWPVSRWCRRCIFFLALWWVLTEGRPTDWGFGLAVAAVAAAFSLLQETGRRFRPSGLLRFAPFFLWESFLAAVEVARLALGPRLRLVPSLVSYRPRLRTLEAQVFFANTVSLLPGTLTADLWEGELRLHVLVAGPHVHDKLAAVEERVAALFEEPGEEDENGSL
jgi:multicomponent Na+:H+ antiporter subunit E